MWEKAELVAEVQDEEIRGLVAGYMNDLENGSAYISLVGVSRDFRNQGLGKKLVHQFVLLCREKQIRSVNLYTHKTNQASRLRCMKVWDLKLTVKEIKIEWMTFIL